MDYEKKKKGGREREREGGKKGNVVNMWVSRECIYVSSDMLVLLW